MQNFNEKSEISLHLVKIWYFLKNRKTWTTNDEIAKNVKFSERTVRMHTLYLVKSGLLDQVEVYPKHRFRISKKADKRNLNFIERLESALAIFQEAEMV